MPRSASLFCMATLWVLLTGSVVPAQAEPAPADNQMAAAAPAAPTGNHAQLLSQGELEAMLAPIALYSDGLLAKVFMASTYPLDIVAAERWHTKNPNLSGAALDEALAGQPWDDSVKNIARVPTVLKMMSERLDWTQKLGNAVLAQQSDVLAAVQTLRGRAQSAGNLKSTPEQTVQVVPASENGGTQPAIVIEPTQQETVYVPYYDTKTVYGSWGYPSYPPYYYPPPYGYAYPAYGYGVGFVSGAILGAAWGSWWNGGFNWGGGYVSHYNNVNVNNWNNYRNNVGNGNRWNGNPARPSQLPGRGGLGNRNGIGGRNGIGRNNIGNRGGVGGRNGIGGRNGVGGRNGIASNRGGVGGRNGVASNRGGRGTAGNRNTGRSGLASNRGGVGGRNGLANRNGVGNRNGLASRGGVGSQGLGSRGGIASNRGGSSGRLAMNGNRARGSSFGGSRGGGSLGSRGGGARAGGARGGGGRGGGGRGGGGRRR